MVHIPEAFFDRMQRLLGEEFPAFKESFRHTSISGLRVNTLKVSVEAFLERTPFKIRCIPGITTGFLVDPREQPGKHPYHPAGLYYLQEPSAMAVGVLAGAQPGECILDLCAAPGGKTTHLASALQGEGWLVANEIHRNRVWELVENLERWGVSNACITNEASQHLVVHFGSFFDRVLVDAPCSGEGMFRRSETTRREWSPALAQSCALRQSGILTYAAQLVKPGGILIYSTCTFSPEENERVIVNFLDDHQEYSIQPLSRFPGASAGQPGWASGRDDLHHTVRFWPHHSAWEGHFVAALRKSESAESQPGKLRVGSNQAIKLDEMPSDILEGILLPEWLARRESQGFRVIFRVNSRNEEELFLISPHLTETANLRLPRPGLWLGTLKKGRTAETSRHARFEPAHALALASQKEDAVQSIDYPADSREILGYLKGETLDESGEDGWVLVCVAGYPLGWGKRHQKVIKNHYPRGLRWV